ncbi:hypothetical protein K474DRAFT_1704125 [Panus rudis PR-1116 ss-1]|nr:hypothetical protein K474DRAFT_1704125 [Panus rudis PR-1116 ss-1]
MTEPPVTSPAVSNWRSNHEVSQQFHVSPVQGFFDPGMTVQPIVTEPLWQGWRVRIHKNLKVGGGMSLFLRPPTMPGIQREVTMTIHVRVTSMTGIHRYAGGGTINKVFGPGRTHGFGWPRLLSVDLWEASALLRQENAILIHIHIRSPPGASPHANPTMDVLHNVISGKRTTDLRFISFQHRDRDALTGPRVFFSSRAVCLPHCKDMLEHINAGEATELLQTVRPEHRRQDGYPSFQTDYDEEDSDFEYAPTRNSPMRGRVRRRKKTQIDTTEILALTQPNDNYTDVIVKGAAPSTWESLLYYLYTGTVVFAPLTREDDEGRWLFIENYKRINPLRPTPCSCKSMYRIAHILNMPELKSRSLQQLEMQLSITVAVGEMFTTFAANYIEIRLMVMNYLLRHWNRVKNSEAWARKLEQVANGSYPYAGGILAELFGKVPDALELPMNPAIPMDETVPTASGSRSRSDEADESHTT